jgi:membrane-bound serine protease (ClpP class)
MILLPPGSAPVETVEPQLRPEHGSPTSEEIGPSLVGQHGVARTILRPAGKVQIAGHFINVVSDGPYIEQGASVEVVKVMGNHVVVRKT